MQHMHATHACTQFSVIIHIVYIEERIFESEVLFLNNNSQILSKQCLEWRHPIDPI